MESFEFTMLKIITAFYLKESYLDISQCCDFPCTSRTVFESHDLGLGPRYFLDDYPGN